MGDRRWRTIWTGVALTAAAAVLVATPSAPAQIPPFLTTTTTPPPTTTTAPPSVDDLTSGADKAPTGAMDAGGDGAAAPAGGIVVPPEAQRIINSVKRTGSNNTYGLVDLLLSMETLGVSRDEIFRVGMGRFPIAGRARYSHDWLYPRYGPGFRFHLGTDVVAEYGTPVRAPVDGVARSSNSSLGGLSVKVHMPDGTYFYMAHLSGLVDGFTEGMPVATGDIVGYVGDSGNARGGVPHVHFGVYPKGGGPVDPKPILDGFIAEAMARLPEVEAALKASRPASPSAAPTAGSSLFEEQRRLRPMLATEAMHPLTAGGAGLPAELLYAAAANPVSGPRALLRLLLDEMSEGIDWVDR